MSFISFPDIHEQANTNGVRNTMVQMKIRTVILGHVIRNDNSIVFLKNMPLKSQ